MSRTIWSYHQELIPPTPRDIRQVCEAAGQDGWELAGMLAVMLPPSARVQQERRTQGGLVLSESVPGLANGDRLSQALQAQLAESPGPTPAVLLTFKRLEQADPDL